MAHCQHCNKDPCLWQVYEESLMEEVRHWLETNATLLASSTEEKKLPTNNVIRKKCYQVFIALHHGYLGKRNREKIPSCVTSAIRQQYPDNNESYIGFKEE